MSLTPLGVLNAHAQLAGRMQKPSRAVASFVSYHMREGLEHYGFTSSFHPVIPQGSGIRPTLEHGAQMARLIGHGLSEAVTYQVTAGMGADMRATYDNAMAGVEHIDKREIPSPAGFAWLDEPWLIGGQETGFTVRALSWEYTEIWTGDKSGSLDEVVAVAGEALLWPCVRLALWRWDGDEPDGLERGASQLGELVLAHTTVVPCGLRFSTPARRDAESTASFLGLIHLLWIYLGMEITSQERLKIPAARRKRAQKSLRHAQVRVVLLRRVKGVTEPGDGQSRARWWSCRWPVQGHYRHRERPADGHHALASGTGKHCATCGQPLSWVQPYLKGPDGLPLHAPGKTVMKLAR